MGVRMRMDDRPWTTTPAGEIECSCLRCIEARTERKVVALEKELELLKGIHASVVGHRDRLVESHRELRAEVDRLNEKLSAIADLAAH